MSEAPRDWEKRINGNAPDEADITRIYPAKQKTSATKWKKVEVKEVAVPQSEERMNRFDRNRKKK